MFYVENALSGMRNTEVLRTPSFKDSLFFPRNSLPSKHVFLTFLYIHAEASLSLDIKMYINIYIF